ncbi:MAG: DNA internalization-related competence protein ComEC/Rec2 [Gemmatimonadota bacterium]
MIVLAYGAGLATGLSHFVVPTCAFLMPAMVLFWRARPQVGLAAAIMLLGAASGGIAAAADAEACATTLPAGRLELNLILSDPADSVGGLVRAVPRGASCRGSITTRWPAQKPSGSGLAWRTTGRWIAAQPGSRYGGTLIVEKADSLVSTASLPDRVRTGLLATTARLYGARAPLVDALILNRRGTLDPDLADAYAQSGLVHILSISGFHVGLIAGWLFLFGRLLRFSRTRAALVSSGLSVLYVAFIGWPAPATRAAALVVLLAVCRWRQRQVEPDGLLAVTCLVVLLLDPHAVFDLGAWLSAAALWGATRFSRWSDRALDAAPGWRMLASSVGATLATAPFTAAALGSVAIVGIALNFVAIPLAAVAVPGVLASLVLHPILPPVSAALAAGAGASLSLLDGVALFGSKVPGGHLIQPVGATAAWPWVGLLVIVLWSLGSRNTLAVAARRWGWGLVVIGWGSLAITLAGGRPDSGSVLTLHFLKVGQGDGAAIRTPGGHWLVIDAGPRIEGVDAGSRVVVPFLRRQGVTRLSAVIVSHVHADHLGGIPAVLEHFPSDIVLEPGDLSSDPRYLEFLNLLAARGLRWRPGRPGDHFMLDSVSFTLLHPDTTWSEWGEDLNEDSIVLLLEFRGFQALFTGDAGLRAEPLLLRKLGTVDVLKVGHHGSRTATGDALLDRVHPKAAVISVGHNNYGHPAPETMARLRRHGIPVWRTDQDGDITITTDGTTMSVCAVRGCQRYPVNP